MHIRGDWAMKDEEAHLIELGVDVDAHILGTHHLCGELLDFTDRAGCLFLEGAVQYNRVGGQLAEQ
jgi:hypothetical protein